MIFAFTLAFKQLSDKSFQKIFWLTTFLSLCLFGLIFLTLTYFWLNVNIGSNGFLFGSISLLVNKLINYLSGLIVVASSIILFPLVMPIILVFFLDSITASVEEKHYKTIRVMRQQPLIEALRISVKFSMLSILVNILVCPIYIFFFFLAPINMIIFYILNGYLFGREYFELVTYRRLDPGMINQLKKSKKNQIFIFGVITTFLATLPIINLIAPVLGAATMVHLFYGWIRQPKVQNQLVKNRPKL